MDAYRKTAPPARPRSRAVTVAAITVFGAAALTAAILARFDRAAPPTTLVPLLPAAQPTVGFGPSPESWPLGTGPQAELEFTHRDDLAALDLLGQYAAELAAPPAGRTDPAAVLAEHQRLRRDLASDDHQVVLLRSTDLNHPVSEPGSWLTVALGDFPDQDAVTVWCHTISAAHCVPRRLDPPR
ncbi:hypothetical protein [Actinoplanes palleronii]|uniref:Uncharacterized protein n=1 Tax=Actinoplanes palleronii TaxID=113570 RepID=A0ABQ4BLM9_9ACTN|nr:hypothetical protein [Actinoplanes palleronii]GIE71581.1 hypothetical protein Apa02nite_076890 [Actinoplanes palleronii]